MAITPGFRTNAEGEEEYYDKGANKTPQINPESDRKYVEAKRQAMDTDFVEWPTKIHGIEDNL